MREVEDLSWGTNLQASSGYEANEDLTAFLKDIAEEETWHYHVIGSAASLLEEEP